MIKIALVGDICSGKTYISKLFREPYFNADNEVAHIYKHDRRCFKKLNTKFPKFFKNFPVNKKDVIKFLLSDDKNIKRLGKIIYPIVRAKLKKFIAKNKKKKIIILDIPLYLENKMHKKNDIIVFVETKERDMIKYLKRRPNFNYKLIKKFKKIQLSLLEKKMKSDHILKNNYKSEKIKNDVKVLKKKLLNERNSIRY